MAKLIPVILILCISMVDCNPSEPFDGVVSILGGIQGMVTSIIEAAIGSPASTTNAENRGQNVCRNETRIG
ncbi:hypothetical protein GCK32_004297 [Trichostrongylus colubriformis]|uniref:Salivary secreted peptide n=1 Tax=Trichostrongylus colubriformis TaxID=6319 RepID=A0AAN8GEZ5_TRICO